MDEQRRQLIQAAVALGAAAIAPPWQEAGQRKAGTEERTAFDPIPPRPKVPTPGKPGDFDFLAGRWRITHRKRLPNNGGWDTFSGEATCWSILGGVGSVEELLIPERNFSGMGLRLLDVKARQWSDFWVNAKSGVLATPGQTGSFEQGVGLFISEYEEEGRTMLAAGVWDRITAHSCRWRQATSADGGRTWVHDWIMDWRKA